MNRWFETELNMNKIIYLQMLEKINGITPPFWNNTVLIPAKIILKYNIKGKSWVKNVKAIK